LGRDAVLEAELCDGTEGIYTKDRKDLLITVCVWWWPQGLFFGTADSALIPKYDMQQPDKA